MVRIFKHITPLFLLSAIVFISSCKKEGEIGDGQKDAFVKFYGTSAYDEGLDVKQTADGGFAILGNTSVGGKGTDISLIKTDAFGNMVWERNYGSNLDDEGKGFEITPDGGFIITGFVTKFDSTNNRSHRQVCLILTDNFGNMVWDSIRHYGSSLFNEEGRGVVITQSGYFIGAISDSIISNVNATDLQVYQTDFDGNLSANVITRGLPGEDIVNHITRVGESIMFIGSTQSGNPNLSLPNVLMVAFDTIAGTSDFSNAEYSWSLNGQSEIAAYGVENNGNIVLLNNIITANGSPIIEVTEIIPGATNIQARPPVTFEIGTRDGIEYNSTSGSSIEKTTDGGYIISGTIQAPNGDLNILLMKIDSEGNKRWDRIFGSNNQNENGNQVIQTNDGGFLILATTGLENDLRISNSMISLVKTDAEGELK